MPVLGGQEFYSAMFIAISQSLYSAWDEVGTHVGWKGGRQGRKQFGTCSIKYASETTQ